MAYGSGPYGAGLYGVYTPATPGVYQPSRPTVPDPEYQILVTDRDLVVVGDPIVTWISIDVTLRLNEPGSGVIVVPAYDWVTAQFEPGNRVVVIRNGAILISGPWERRMVERSDDGENSGVGKITVNFADDLASVVARQTYPNPALDPDSQDVDQWTYTGNAELALRALVNLNAGPGALTERRVPALVLGGTTGVGSSVTVTAARMAPLGEIARQIADVGGGLIFRTRQVGTQIQFQVDEPADVSGSVRFGFSYGNLKYVGVEYAAPKATAAIVGGQGETGADRFVTERVNTVEQTLWGRYEVLVSRSGSAPLAELEDEGDLELAETAATVRIATNVSDTPEQQYGVHYDVGSLVAVEHEDGAQIVDVVRTVHLQAFPTAGEVVSTSVGSQAAQTNPAWVYRVRQIEQRLGKLERSVVPSGP